MAKMTARQLFTQEEKQRIEAAVKAAELKTSGEIVPMVVDESYDYPRAEILGGGILALFLAALLVWFSGHDSVWLFLPLFILLFFACKSLLHHVPGLKRRLIHPAEIAAEVEEKALVAFIEQGLHHTRDSTGILILVSLFERRVHVLADQGINSVVAPQVWDEIVAIVTDGIKQNRTCDAICKAVARCGELLTENFPRKEDDTDELPNLIVE